jgi:hypothetical protein
MDSPQVEVRAKSEAPERPLSREAVVIEFVLGEARDIIEAQRANLETTKELLVSVAELRDSIVAGAAKLDATVTDATVELVEHYRDMTKTLRDFRQNAGNEVAAPIMAGVTRAVRRESARLVVVAGVAAVVGSVVGGVVAALFMR